MPGRNRFLRLLSGSNDYVTLPKNLVASLGTLYEDFSSAADWTVGGTGASVADDTTNYHTGTQSVALTLGNAATCSIHKIVNWDLSGDWGTMEFWYRLNDAVADYQGSITIKLSNDSSFSNFFRVWHASGEYRQPGWNNMVCHKNSFGIGLGSPSWDSPIVRVRFEFRGASGKTPSISFDSLYFGIKRLPAVIMRFDDGYPAQYSTCFSYMKPHNVRGELATISSLVDTDGYVTKSQIQEMDASGWSIVNHTSGSATLDTLTEAQQETVIGDCKTALTGWGLSRCADYLVCPGGKANTDTDTACANLGIKTAQTTGVTNSIGGKFVGLPYAANLNICGQTISDTVSLDTWKGYVDLAIACGYIFPFTFHNVGTGAEWTVDTFRQAINYLALKRSQIYCITIDDFYNLQSNSVRVLKMK
jgi:hypothetical protein